MMTPTEQYKYDSKLNNPRNKWERLYVKGGNRRKVHVHTFNLSYGRDYRVCTCGISDVYYNSTLQLKTATGSNL